MQLLCKKNAIGLAFLILLFQSSAMFGQTNNRLINRQNQAWLSINTTAKVSEKWSIIGDVHMRRNNFVSDPSFYFVRTGLQYAIQPTISLTLGYGHMWVAPTRSDWKTFSNENRIYQQAILTSKLGKVGLLHRIRNEQRWQQVIANDQPLSKWRFTNRVRYLLSATIPLSKKASIPKLVIADELLVHFGKQVVYNTFDQNRIFIGIRQQITKALSADFGYMQVYQQRYSGYQYDLNHTTRLFFYWNPQWWHKPVTKHVEPNHAHDE